VLRVKRYGEAMAKKKPTLDDIIAKHYRAKSKARKLPEEIDGWLEAIKMMLAVQDFETAKHGNGKPKFPRFQQVRREMGLLMETDTKLRKVRDGKRKLELAYDMVVAKLPKRSYRGTSRKA
jgi:hypothetical protein